MLVRISKSNAVRSMAFAIGQTAAYLAVAVYFGVDQLPARGDIYNTQTGQVIPVTQGIYPGSGIDLSTTLIGTTYQLFNWSVAHRHIRPNHR